MVLLKEYFAIEWRYENCKSNKERKALDNQAREMQDRKLSNGMTVWEFDFADDEPVNEMHSCDYQECGIFEESDLKVAKLEDLDTKL